jgi:cell division protease FtsH
MNIFIIFALLFELGLSLKIKNYIYMSSPFKKNYNPFGQKYYENYLKKLNSKNITIQNESIDSYYPEIEINIKTNNRVKGYKRNNLNQHQTQYNSDTNSEYYDLFGNPVSYNSQNKKSENFEVIQNFNFSFKDIGGYDNIKSELSQCIDILNNYTKYEKYNIRIPKGLILEGPPGNGKTLIAKGFAGETNTNFIAVSGSQFQEKYVGVGQTRVRELFKLAKENAPCVIFIDEIDAIGRKRSSDGESSSSERDNTLNELLINLDGFKTTPGLFLIGATNRIDLLDPALLRPGRIDKKIFIGLPDSNTRESIISLHLKGKPYNLKTINIKDLVDFTAGLSGAQIENLLNEAMLNALRANRDIMEYQDIDIVMNKMMVGWQPTEHQFSSDIIDRIAIHEMGHAIVGYFSKHHSKVSKVIINLSAPNSPGYTLFETTTSSISTREALFEHLMILLAGRIAEEIFYDVSVTTGAINDFQEAFKLAEKMIIYYGMGKTLIYPNLSDKYKQKIDDEVVSLIRDAYQMSKLILVESKSLIYECASILKKDKIIKADKLMEIINKNHRYLL